MYCIIGYFIIGLITAFLYLRNTPDKNDPELFWGTVMAWLILILVYIVLMPVIFSKKIQN